MASLTIRNLDDALKTRLRIRAAERGRSMEEEARHILRRTLFGEEEPATNLAVLAQELFGPEHGVDLDLPERGPARGIPSFER
jgi:plasmid stability protein